MGKNVSSSLFLLIWKIFIFLEKLSFAWLRMNPKKFIKMRKNVISIIFILLYFCLHLYMYCITICFYIHLSLSFGLTDDGFWTEKVIIQKIIWKTLKNYIWPTFIIFIGFYHYSMLSVYPNLSVYRNNINMHDTCVAQICSTCMHLLT